MAKPIVVPGGKIIMVRRGHWLSSRYGMAARHSHKSREDAVAFLATKPTSREVRMPVKVKTKVKAKPAAAKAAPKRATAKVDLSKLRAAVAKGLKQGKKISEIAEELHVTSGRAAFYNMLNVVEAEPKLRIKGRNEDETVANLVKAREKADQHSSWGWLSARSGIAEARVIKLCEAAGIKGKGSHIARERAEAKGTTTKTKAKTKVTVKKGKGTKDPSA